MMVKNSWMQRDGYADYLFSCSERRIASAGGVGLEMN
jgi:hypothetical protein